MNVCEINPLVRFAARVSYLPHAEYAIAPDKRVFVFSDGDGAIDIAGEVIRTAEHLAVYIPPCVPYRFIGESALSFMSVNFDLTGYRSHHTSTFPRRLVTSSDLDRTPDPENIEEFSAPFSVLLPESTAELTKKLSEEYFAKKPYYELKLSAILGQLLAEMMRIKELPLATPADKRLKKAVEFIEENYHSDINNSDIAAAVGYHSYHLERLFRAQLGVSIHGYLINRRLTAAQQFLLSTDLSVTEIGMRVGFNSTVSFTGNFKAKYALTPSAFRTRHTKTV